jgi:glycosyltransferase involved in cell wall biosynthesis
MPNIVLESMAAGVPIVATDVGGVKEMAGDSECPVIIPARDHSAIAQAVTDLLADADRAGSVAAAGCKRVAEAYAPARQRVQLRDLYAELMPGFGLELEVQPERFASARIQC